MAEAGALGDDPTSMSSPRVLLKGLLRLGVAAAFLIGAIAAYRLLVHPLIVATLSLDEWSSSIVRRASILAAAVLSYGAFVRYYERRKAQELALRWRWTVIAGAAGALSIGVTILALYATGHYELIAVRGFGQVPGVLAAIGIAAVLEELAFRGILFRILEETLGTRVALVASATIFGVVHLTNNGARWITLISVTLAGLMWAGVFILSRNIWVAAAHHACWNSTIFLIGVPLSGEDWIAQAPLETALHGSVLWTGGAFGPEDSLVNIAICTAICGALWQMARRGNKVVLRPRS